MGASEFGARPSESLILVTVKSYDTEKLADSIGHLIDKDGIVVSLQNGLGNIETVARRFGSQQVLGGRVIFGSEMVAPGRVRVTVIAQPVAIGPAPKIHGDECANLHARAIEIAAAINSAGVPAEAVDDITPVLWLKVLYNVAMNPLGALLRCHYGALGEVAETRSIMEDAVTEAFAVSQNLHVDLGFRSADDFIGHLYDKLLPPTYDHRPSMLYDLEKRGRTEIEALNGMIVQLGERYSVPTPVNRMLTSMIHARERLVRAQLSIPAGE